MAQSKKEEKESAKKVIKINKEQEKMLKLNILEQEAREIEQQLILVEQQINELRLLSLNLDDIDKKKTGDEMLSALGRNIFLKAALQEKEVLVDVGSKVMVKKNIQEAKKIIEKDIQQFEELKEKLAERFQKFIEEINKTISE